MNITAQTFIKFKSGFTSLVRFFEIGAISDVHQKKTTPRKLNHKLSLMN